MEKKPPAAYLHIQQLWSNIIIHLDSSFLTLDEREANIASFCSIFGRHQAPEAIIWTFSC